MQKLNRKCEGQTYRIRRSYLMRVSQPRIHDCITMIALSRFFSNALSSRAAFVLSKKLVFCESLESLVLNMFKKSPNYKNCCVMRDTCNKNELCSHLKMNVLSLYRFVTLLLYWLMNDMTKPAFEIKIYSTKIIIALFTDILHTDCHYRISKYEIRTISPSCQNVFRCD